MRHRLTALVLAFIVASPACWCGWTHASQASHVRSCCLAKAKSKPGAPAKDKDCPCLNSLKARDLTQAKVKVPSPMLSDLHLPVLAAVEAALLVPDNAFAVLELRNHGPPREPRRLYYLDCSLLI